MTTFPLDEPTIAVEPAGQLLRGLWQLDHHRERASRAMEIGLGVSERQRMMLRLIGKYPGITPGQLAAALHLDAGSVSTAVGRLVRKGFVERRPGRRDRRRVTLGLTEAGRGIDGGPRGAVELAVVALKTHASAEDVGAMLRMVKQLSDLLEMEAACLLERSARPVRGSALRHRGEGRIP